MATHEWKNHRIKVGTRLIPLHAWLVIELVVRVDGGAEYRSRRSWDFFSTSVSFDLEEGGRHRRCVVRSGRPCSALSTRYEVFVEGERVGEGRARAVNWGVPYVMAGVILVLGALAVWWVMGMEPLV